MKHIILTESYVRTYGDERDQLVRRLVENCMKSCEQYGYDYELFHAVTPAQVPEYLQQTGLVFEGHISDPTFACCSLTHYLAWQKIAKGNETFVVLEGDAYYVRPLPEYDYENNLVLLTGTWRGHGTAINPRAAKTLVELRQRGTGANKANDMLIKDHYNGALIFMPEKYPVIKGNQDPRVSPRMRPIGMLP